jgi:hypothetical protein
MKQKIKILPFVLITVLTLFPMRLYGQETNDYVTRALNDSRFSWESTSDKGITIYYQSGSFAQKHRMMLLGSLKTSISEVLNLLEETKYTDTLNVFYLESRDEMETIVGRPYSGFSNWSANGIFLVLNPQWRSFERHEFAHIVTMGLWGEPDSSSRWMIEGIPIYCDGWCQEYSVQQIAFSLLKTNQLPDIHVLFDNYFNLGEIRAGFSSASLIGFIIDTFGTNKLRELWHDGSARIEQILGKDAATIDESWREYIKRSEVDEIDIDFESIKMQGCG